MAISAGEIMARLNAWAESSEGKKKIAEKIKSYREGKDAHVSATGKTYGGGEIVTYDQMQNIAKDLIVIIRRHAASAGLPSSVMEHVESFADSPFVVNPDGSVSIEINMTDNPSRESLQPTQWDGVENIVAIFNRGYKAGGSVYGPWKTAGKDIWSLRRRDGSFFLQEAVKEFNAKYGEKYDVTVRIDSQYEKNY